MATVPPPRKCPSIRPMSQNMDTSYTIWRHYLYLYYSIVKITSWKTSEPECLKKPRKHTEPLILTFLDFLFSPYHCLLVFLAIVGQDQILELHLHFDPFLVSQGGPDMVWFCNSCLVWLQDHLCPVIVHMQGTQNQDEAGESLEETWQHGGGQPPDALLLSSSLPLQGIQNWFQILRCWMPPPTMTQLHMHSTVTIPLTGWRCENAPHGACGSSCGPKSLL